MGHLDNYNSQFFRNLGVHPYPQSLRPRCCMLKSIATFNPQNDPALVLIHGAQELLKMFQKGPKSEPSPGQNASAQHRHFGGSKIRSVSNKVMLGGQATFVLKMTAFLISLNYSKFTLSSSQETSTVLVAVFEWLMFESYLGLLSKLTSMLGDRFRLPWRTYIASMRATSLGSLRFQYVRNSEKPV